MFCIDENERIFREMKTFGGESNSRTIMHREWRFANDARLGVHVDGIYMKRLSTTMNDHALPVNEIIEERGKWTAEKSHDR